jgi:YD repeat-containing protein
MMKKNKPKYEAFLALEQDKKAALAYANETVNSLSSDEQDRVQKIGLDLFARYAETQKLRREIAQLKSEIDALSRPSYSSSTSKPTTSGSSSSSGSSGRNEIVDDYGRTQGYSEDGRLYDQKGNVTGYVDEYNRVYDSDHKRVGEVRTDGKIEKYR